MINILIRGQALIEYLFIFAFIGLVSVGMMKNFGTSFSTSMGSLNFMLTQELSVGVCETYCLGDQYGNLQKAAAEENP